MYRRELGYWDLQQRGITPHYEPYSEALRSIQGQNLVGAAFDELARKQNEFKEAEARGMELERLSKSTHIPTAHLRRLHGTNPTLFDDGSDRGPGPDGGGGPAPGGGGSGGPSGGSDSSRAPSASPDPSRGASAAGSVPRSTSRRGTEAVHSALIAARSGADEFKRKRAAEAIQRLFARLRRDREQREAHAELVADAARGNMPLGAAPGVTGTDTTILHGLHHDGSDRSVRPGDGPMVVGEDGRITVAHASGSGRSVRAASRGSVSAHTATSRSASPVYEDASEIALHLPREVLVKYVREISTPEELFKA